MNPNYYFSIEKKKDEGIYFTPIFITKYICKKAIIYSLTDNNKTDSIDQLLDYYKNNLNILYQKLGKLKILDPSCGDGAFIFTFYDLLIEIYRKIAQLQNIKLNSEIKYDIIKNNLYGVDINEQNINQIKIKIIDILNIKNCEYFKLFNNFKVGNSIISNKDSDKGSFSWKSNFDTIIDSGGFDIIIGNPPWGAKIKQYKKYIRDNYNHILKGQFDSSSIFLYFNIKNLLKKDGIIGYVVPNELCLSDINRSLREYILKYQILELINLGFNIFQNVQKPTLVFLLRKSSISIDQNHQIRIFSGLKQKEKKLLKNNNFPLKKIVNNNFMLRKQIDFVHNICYRFDIFSDQFDLKIKNIIKKNNFKPLSEYFISGRGIDTNRKGNYIICPECKLLNSPFGKGHSGRIKKKKCRTPDCNYEFNKKLVSNYESINLISDQDFPQNGYNAPGYIGEDLHKLYFNRNPRAFRYYNFIKKGSQNEIPKLNFSDIKWGKDFLYYGEKLLIRKVSTSFNLHLMIYKDFLITNQQIYIFKKKKVIQEISIYYFCGILASRLIFYYYLKEFGDPDKQILPHFTQKAIKSLPIPIIDPDDDLYKNIVFNTKKIIQLISDYNILSDNSQLKKEIILKHIKEYHNLLDNNIFTLYNINDQRIINKIIIKTDQFGFKII